MNGMEARYAQELERRRMAGEVSHWSFEAMKLRLADRTWYTPDFRVLMPDGSIECHEVKGFREAAGQVKIKVAAELHPFRFVMVRRSSKKKDGATGTWVLDEVEGAGGEANAPNDLVVATTGAVPALQPCGHTVSAIVCDATEGTCYCGDCGKEKGQ